MSRTRESGLVGCARPVPGNPRYCRCSGSYYCYCVGNGEGGVGGHCGHCMSCDGPVRRSANDIRADDDVHLRLNPPTLSRKMMTEKKIAIADAAETGKASGCSAEGRRAAVGYRQRRWSRPTTRRIRKIQCRVGDLDS